MAASQQMIKRSLTLVFRLAQGIGLGLVLSTIYLFFGVGFFFGSSYIADGITDVGSVLTTAHAIVYACILAKYCTTSEAGSTPPNSRNSGLTDF